MTVAPAAVAAGEWRPGRSLTTAAAALTNNNNNSAMYGCGVSSAVVVLVFVNWYDSAVVRTDDACLLAGWMRMCIE